jgi:hypothetical protein
LGQAVLTALTFASLCLILFSFSGFSLTSLLKAAYNQLTDNMDAVIDNGAGFSFCVSKNPPVALCKYKG